MFVYEPSFFLSSFYHALPALGHITALARSPCLFVGAGGGIIAMALTYPLITIGTRLQVQKTTARKTSSKRIYTSTLDAVRKIYKYEGFRGFYA